MVKQFECQNCGAGIEFDPTTHALKCDYCGSVKLVEAAYDVPVEHDLFAAPKNQGWDLAMATVQCESCGATISSEEMAGDCAFCGSHYVKEIPPNKDIIRPETMVPFRIDRQGALERFRKWLGKGFFRPSNLKRMGKLEMIQGVYTPFWTYDCHAHSGWSAMSGYYYYVTRTVRTSQGTRTVRERKIRWVPSSGSRDGNYDDVLILASKGLDQDLVNKISPFRLEYLEKYKPEFLSGWLAEHYAVGVIEGWMKARWKVLGWERDKCARAVPGDTHRALSVNTAIDTIRYKHILLPVYVAAYRYKRKLYHFLVNGQTGEVQGEAPISWLKVAAVVLAIVGLIAGIYFFGWT